jgi:hypothetical protein
VSKLYSAVKQESTFSTTICNDDLSTEYELWWPKLYKKNTMTLQPYDKAARRAQKVNFSISRHYICEYSCQRPRKIITDVIDGFITNNVRVLPAPNKIPDLQKEKSPP